MRKINIQATEGKTYDLNEIVEQGRENSEKPLLLHNWYWHPEAVDDIIEHSKPDPANPVVGQIWVSIKCNSLKELQEILAKQGI